MYVYCLLRGHCLQHLHHMLSTLLSGETEGSWQVSASSLPHGNRFYDLLPPAKLPKNLPVKHLFHPTKALFSFLLVYCSACGETGIIAFWCVSAASPCLSFLNSTLTKSETAGYEDSRIH